MKSPFLENLSADALLVLTQDVPGATEGERALQEAAQAELFRRTTASRKIHTPHRRPQAETQESQEVSHAG